MAELLVAVITIESLLGSVGASVVGASVKEKADAGQDPVHTRGAPIGTETVTAKKTTAIGEIETETEIGSETGIEAGATATTVTVTGTETETDVRTAIDVTATMETTAGGESTIVTGPLGETVAVLVTVIVMHQPRVAAAAGVTLGNEWLE